MLDIIAAVQAYQQLGFGGILLGILFLVVRHFIKENKKFWEKYEDQLKSHKEEMAALTNKMISALEENSSSHMALTKSIDSLENRLRA